MTMFNTKWSEQRVAIRWRLSTNRKGYAFLLENWKFILLGFLFKVICVDMVLIW